MIADPPVSEGADQDTAKAPSPTVIRLMVGASGAVWGVAEAGADQGPSPALVTARSCTSYRTPLVRLDRGYCSAPELQMLSRSVQLASDLSPASLRM